MIFGRAENIRILGCLSGFGGAGIGGEFPLPLSFNTMQYFPSAHPRFSSRRSVASASPRLLATDGRNGLPAHAHIRLKRLRAGPVKDRRTSEKKVKIHTLNCTTFRPARKSSNPVLMQVLPRRRSCVETRRAPSLPLVAPPLGFPRYRAPEGGLEAYFVGGTLPHIFIILLPDKARNGGRRSRSAAKPQSDRWSPKRFAPPLRLCGPIFLGPY